ncbi:hypothetical protein [Rubinisphaera margarita]|uniref:hypothetical protein n=1 Tax=Rubinisphaera margarita TaxID=2909586 RepID=UPI001EE894F9|nr:hypothetical protein [Rubinisphaera margarita]MCG6157539.1 hypothetical protein [Rubinisphaera margarita]
MGKRTFRVNRSRSPLLATTLVMIGGLFTCLLIAVPFSDDLTIPLLVLAGGFLLLAVALGYLRQRTHDVMAELYALTWQKPKKKVQFKLQRRHNIPQTGPRKPPTVEQIREIKGK